VSDHDPLVVEMMIVMISAAQKRARSCRPEPLSASRCGKPTAVGALRRGKGSLFVDQRGAVAFEMPIVYLFLIMVLLLPLSDLAIFGFQYISAWQALRAFGEYLQYNQPPDVTSTTTWASGLQTSVAGYPINNVQVLCGDTSAGAACTSTNVTTLPAKYYSYTTTVTLTPMVLRSVLCTSSNANPCSFTLPYTERFQ
jgi:hypothetical protein